MINNLDKDSKRPNCFSLNISRADFKDLFWEKQSMFTMAFIISNFFLDNAGHNVRSTFIMLAEPAYISGKQ